MLDFEELRKCTTTKGDRMPDLVLSQGSSSPEYCLLWIDFLCMPRSDWASWVQAFGAIAAIVGALYVVKWQHRLSARADAERREADAVSKAEALGPAAVTAAHYIERACAYAEKGDRDAHMDITNEKLERVLADLNIKSFDNPNAIVAKAINLLRIALGRAISGLNQWSRGTGQQVEAGIIDLRTARKISREALDLLDSQTTHTGRPSDQ